MILNRLLVVLEMLAVLQNLDLDRLVLDLAICLAHSVYAML